ncbi:membrane-associated calcum-binding protein, putative [Babesia bigemina]|uniref:Membrane-associated calcum-binding protein, putative n=1 Tax=Babesia bigemina TaxID=5866 RepID=A0A061DE08_BABBI|nr:membrane-associated calcum-binding protein, putative [Babesia bigemina]CDR96745.1 membrane-associated calcum-binding protein, putative [Babesia bigemina]|eukprot:XP_012768931.1 membrane-associated calcum-binding protein, putative [Babesia bigemina]
MKAVCAFAVLLALAVPAAAWVAEDGEEHGAEDHPAGLSREQVEAKMGKLFGIIDDNKDGLIVTEELEKFNSKNLQRVQNMQLEQEMQMVDKNKDGLIDFEELSLTFPPDAGTPDDFMEGLNRRFNIADKDGDGKLTKAEMHILLNPAHDEAMLELEIKEIMLTHDKNGDGLISTDEYAATKGDDEKEDDFLEIEFKPFDLNGDGLLSSQELVLAFKEEATEDVETSLEDVIAILGTDPVDYAIWMKYALELSTSSVTDHGELLRFPGDYDLDLSDETRERKGQEGASDYPSSEL